MADAVATQTIQDNGSTAIFRFTNVSDGTGESAVTKIDVSALAVDPVTERLTLLTLRAFPITLVAV